MASTIGSSILWEDIRASLAQRESGGLPKQMTIKLSSWSKGHIKTMTKSRCWPAFQHEVGMQRQFNEDKLIRCMVDFLPSGDVDEPMMVLEPYEQTLWDARLSRPMTAAEIKWIMEGILLGLHTIHQRGLVHTDLKMENVGISGFDNKPNENIRTIIVRIADCGSVSEQGTRQITSLAYRSPEVHFGKAWSQSTDILSWGIILAQLFLTQVDFDSAGTYDAISGGKLEDKSKLAREAIATYFDLYSIPLDAEEMDSASLLPPPKPDDIYVWAVRMSEKGISGEDIQFLVDVLNPRPDVRLTADEIMASGYIKKRE